MILHFCFLLCTLKLWLGFWDLFWFQELSTHTKRLLSPSRERIKDLKIVNFFQLSTCQVGCVIVRAGNLHTPIDLCLVCWKDNELSEYSSIVSNICFTLNFGPFMSKLDFWIIQILKLLRQSAFLKLSWPPCCLVSQIPSHIPHIPCAAPNAQQQRKCVSIVNTQTIF